MTASATSTPLAAWLARRPRPEDRALIVGLSGSQGSGKSTIAAEVVDTLDKRFGLRAAVVSIDDVYLTLAEREALGAKVHPLLRTRGVPGTHDVPLCRRVLSELARAGAGESVAVPRFDKAVDDRRPDSDTLEGRFDIVILEGWCVGLPPMVGSLAEPFNALEREQDAEGTWRDFVAAQLEGPYAELWSDLDVLVALIAPDIDTVVRWRTQQEHALVATGATGRGLMSDDDVRFFVAHYERWTEHGIARLPQVADRTVWLDGVRRPIWVSSRA